MRFGAPRQGQGGYRWDTPCEDGRYPARIASCREGKSRAGGDQLVLMIEVDGSHGGALVEHYLPCGSWEERWQQALIAVGRPDEAKRLHETDVDPTWFDGRRVEAQVDHWPPGPDGRVKLRCVTIYPPTSSPAGEEEVPF